MEILQTFVIWALIIKIKQANISDTMCIYKKRRTHIKLLTQPIYHIEITDQRGEILIYWTNCHSFVINFQCIMNASRDEDFFTRSVKSFHNRPPLKKIVFKLMLTLSLLRKSITFHVKHHNNTADKDSGVRPWMGLHLLKYKTKLVITLFKKLVYGILHLINPSMTDEVIVPRNDSITLLYNLYIAVTFHLKELPKCNAIFKLRSNIYFIDVNNILRGHILLNLLRNEILNLIHLHMNSMWSNTQAKTLSFLYNYFSMIFVSDKNRQF